MEVYKGLVERFGKERINRLEEKIHERFITYCTGTTMNMTSSQLMEKYYTFRIQYLNRLIKKLKLI